MEEIHFCCERFQEVYNEEDAEHEVFIYTVDFDETQWYIPGVGHMYYCPFCGSYIAGNGFGKPWIPKKISK